MDESERQIEKLQQKIEKLRFMKGHLEMLNQGLGSYTVRPLPSRYVMFCNNTGEIDYGEIKKIMNQPFFSFGNFCYSIGKDTQGKFVPLKLSFVIRESMFAINPAKKEEVLEHLEECKCIYTVCSNGELENPRWQLNDLYEFAAENGYQPAKSAYAFYVYSLISDDGIVDFYEIYVPIL